MPILTVLIGLALIATGLGFKLGTGTESNTALIPAVFGVIVALLGAVAMIPKARKHAMHGVMALALLAVIGTIIPLITRQPEGSALYSQLITLTLSAVLLALGVTSFVQARRARRKALAA